MPSTLTEGPHHDEDKRRNHQSINQSINQSVNQSTNQSINPSFNQSVNQYTKIDLREPGRNRATLPGPSPTTCLPASGPGRSRATSPAPSPTTCLRARQGSNHLAGPKSDKCCQPQGQAEVEPPRRPRATCLLVSDPGKGQITSPAQSPTNVARFRAKQKSSHLAGPKSDNMLVSLRPRQRSNHLAGPKSDKLPASGPGRSRATLPAPSPTTCLPASGPGKGRTTESDKPQQGYAIMEHQHAGQLGLLGPAKCLRAVSAATPNPESRLSHVAGSTLELRAQACEGLAALGCWGFWTVWGFGSG